MDKLDEDTRHFFTYLDSIFKGMYFNCTRHLLYMSVKIHFDITMKVRIHESHKSEMLMEEKK